MDGTRMPSTLMCISMLSYLINHGGAAVLVVWESHLLILLLYSMAHSLSVYVYCSASYSATNE